MIRTRLISVLWESRTVFQKWTLNNFKSNLFEALSLPFILYYLGGIIYLIIITIMVITIHIIIIPKTLNSLLLIPYDKELGSFMNCSLQWMKSPVWLVLVPWWTGGGCVEGEIDWPLAPVSFHLSRQHIKSLINQKLHSILFKLHSKFLAQAPFKKATCAKMSWHLVYITQDSTGFF